MLKQSINYETTREFSALTPIYINKPSENFGDVPVQVCWSIYAGSSRRDFLIIYNS
jgi:hypothetical protein